MTTDAEIAKKTPEQEVNLAAQQEEALALRLLERVDAHLAQGTPEQATRLDALEARVKVLEEAAKAPAKPVAVDPDARSLRRGRDD